MSSKPYIATTTTFEARASSGPALGEDGLAVNDDSRSMTEPVDDHPPLTVLYDGACPLCRREIGMYRSLRPIMPVCYADASDAALPLPPGTTREKLLTRFHVRGRDGELLSGAQAFLALWAALPGWRWLARVGRLPGMPWAMERIYRLFLRWRPTLQHWASHLDRPDASR
jgi:predicted DCC family thiol-disulfide oxidoreductase YuxK